MTREICRPYWNQSGYEPLNSENVLCKGVEATERTLGRLSAMFFFPIFPLHLRKCTSFCIKRFIESCIMTISLFNNKKKKKRKKIGEEGVTENIFSSSYYCSPKWQEHYFVWSNAIDCWVC